MSLEPVLGVCFGVYEPQRQANYYSDCKKLSDANSIKSSDINGLLSVQTAVGFPPKQRVARSTRANRTSKIKPSRDAGRLFDIEYL